MKDSALHLMVVLTVVVVVALIALPSSWTISVPDLPWARIGKVALGLLLLCISVGGLFVWSRPDKFPEAYPGQATLLAVFSIIGIGLSAILLIGGIV